jgi:hypothetical protein
MSRRDDATILMLFRAQVDHLRHRPADPEMQAEMHRLGLPTLEALKRNGHDLRTAIGLMRDTFDHQPPAPSAVPAGATVYK